MKINYFFNIFIFALLLMFFCFKSAYANLQIKIADDINDNANTDNVSSEYKKYSFLSAETQEGLSKLKGRIISIGVFSPYDYNIKDDKKEAGNAALFRKLLEEVFGFTVFISRLESEEEARTVLKKGQLDIVFGLRKKSKNDDDIYFSKSIYTRHLYIISSERQSKNLRQNNIKSLQGRYVLFYEGLDTEDNFTKFTNINIDLIKYTDIDKMVKEINDNNEMDFGIIPADIIFDTKILAMQNRIVEAKDLSDSSGRIAVKDKDLIPLVNAVEQYYKNAGKMALDMFSAENINALYSIAFSKWENLTEEQEKFIKNPDGLKIYITNPMYPLVYTDSEQKFNGIYIDMFNDFSKISQMPITYIPISKNEADIKKKYLKDNEIIANYYLDDEDKIYLTNFSGYFNAELIIYGRSNSKTNWRDFERIGALKNSQAAKYLDQNGFPYKKYETGDELFNALGNKEIDFVAAHSQWYYEQILKSNYKITKIESTPVTLWPDMFVCNKTSPVISLFETAMSGFIDYTGIMIKWKHRKDETVTKLISEYYDNINENAKRKVIISIIISLMFILIVFLYIAMRMRTIKNKALIIAAEAEKSANKAKSQFLSNMSHEIRTPLHAILGLARLAVMNNSKIAAIDSLKKIEEAGVHLLTIINNVLDMSKIEAGKFELISETFDMKQTIRVIQTMISVKAAEKNLNFNIETDNNLPQFLMGDSKSIRQILINLLSNAVKFTPEHGLVYMKITCKNIDNQNVMISFKVKDTGIGMTEEQAKKIFLPFEQANAHISKNFGGTGLGLPISKHLAELMGGNITLETEEGKGSSFTFTAPFGIAEIKEREESDNTLELLKNTNLNILIADDTEINRVILSAMISNITTPNITEAQTGKEAFEIYQKSEINYFDIIFMDIQMPEMNGYEATQAIRKSERSDAKTVQIIATTASAFKEDIEEAIQAGMNSHVSKPIDTADLVQTIKNIIEMKK